MLQIENQGKFNRIVSDAIEAAITNSKDEQTAKRWAKAIDKAVQKIDERGEFMTYFADENYLLIWSDSNEIYTANGKCQCRAFAEGKQPCWHRAAARLVRIYFGGAENTSPRFPNDAPQAVPNIALPAAFDCHISGAGSCDRDTFNSIMLGGASSPFYSEVER